MTDPTATPAPTEPNHDVDAWEALRERITALVDAVTRLGVEMDVVLAVLGFAVADEGWEDEGGQE